MKKLFAIAFLLAFLAPAVALAANPWAPFWGPILSCTGNYNSKITNILTPTVAGAVTKTCVSLCDLLVTGQNLINFMLTLALYVAAPIMAAAGGVFILISGGSSEKVSTGKQMLTGAGIGILIVLLAFPVLDTFFTLLGATTGAAHVSWPSISCNFTLPQPVTPPTPGVKCAAQGIDDCDTGYVCIRNSASTGGFQCVKKCGGTVFGYCDPISSSGNCLKDPSGNYSCK